MGTPNMTRRLVHMPRTGKRLLALTLDASLCALTVWLAWMLRLEHWIPFSRMHAWATLGAWLRETRRPAAAILEGGYHDDLPLLIDAFLSAWNSPV